MNKQHVTCVTFENKMKNAMNGFFIYFLNMMHTNTQTYNDLMYLNTNCMSLHQTTKLFLMSIFHRNKDVSMHKRNVISIFVRHKIVMNEVMR
jgi:hypothetical protein